MGVDVYIDRPCCSVRTSSAQTLPPLATIDISPAKAKRSDPRAVMVSLNNFNDHCYCCLRLVFVDKRTCRPNAKMVTWRRDHGMGQHTRILG